MGVEGYITKQETLYSWTKILPLELADELRSHYEKGFLIVQFLSDSVSYVVDLSDVPKCGSFNPYGNEQMEVEIITKDSTLDQVVNFFTEYKNAFYKPFLQFEGYDGKMLFELSKEDLLSVALDFGIQKVKSIPLYNLLHPNEMEIETKESVMCVRACTLGQWKQWVKTSYLYEEDDLDEVWKLLMLKPQFKDKFSDYDDNKFKECLLNVMNSSDGPVFSFCDAILKGWNNQIQKSPNKSQEMEVEKDSKRRDIDHTESGRPVKTPKLSSDDAMSRIMNGNYSPPIFPSAEQEFFGREESLEVAEEYIKGAIAKSPHSFVEKDLKFKLLGTSGMKGIGKSELLKQIGKRMMTVKIDEFIVRSVYLTFNGGIALTKSKFLEDFQITKNYCNAFGHLLLDSCGVPRNLSCLLNFDHSLKAFRSIMKMAEKEVLLVLVDEIGNLGAPHDVESIKSLMTDAMDANDGKLIFIFAHIAQEFLNKQATASGRPVIPLALPPLDIDIWKKLTELAEASAKSPALHQLFLSCSGHPRSIFEGIKSAKTENPSLLTDPNPAAITRARTTIIETSKFSDISDSVTHGAILKWFSQTPPSDEEITEWSNSGLLHTLKGTDPPIQFLFPLLINHWAQKKCEIHPIAYHLQQLFDADACLDRDSEKKMEAVMYHYEAVLRLAQAEKEFYLGPSFQTIHYEKQFDILVQASRKGIVARLVTCQPDFTQISSVYQFLNDGLIVVSEKHSEIGTEYLVPYFKFDKLHMVAFVQCKYVQTSTNWKDIIDKLKKSMKPFEDSQEFSKVRIFPVVYTTVDQDTIKSNTYEGGVYYTENDLFNYTSKLGILRLHTQKLGEKLQSKYPVLKRANSGTY